MVLINTPPGYGKTLLLSEISEAIRQSRNNSLQWISIHDEGDVGNLRDILLDFAETTSELNLRYLFIDDIDSLPQIDRKTLFDTIRALFTAGIRIIISSTKFTDELMSLYSRGLVTIYNKTHLAFSFEESASYLKSKRTDSSDSQIAMSFEFTEGWIEGLYLISEDNRRFDTLKSYASSKYIDRYFMQKLEEFEHKDLLSYLEQISLLDLLIPDLCNFLTERNDSYDLLKALEQDGFFTSFSLESSDSFHYDNAFKYWLQTKLLRDFSESDIRELNQRAGKWFEDTGMDLIAAKCYLRSSDRSFVEDLTRTSFPEMPRSGKPFQEWVSAIVIEKMSEDPFICTMVSWVYVCMGRASDAMKWVHLLPVDALDNNETLSYLRDNNIALGYKCIEAKCLSLECRYTESLKLLHSLAPLIQGQNSTAMQCLFSQTIAESYEHQGKLDEALEYYTKAEAFGEMGKYQLVTALCRYNLATIHYGQGKLFLAESICRKALLDCPEDYTLHGGLLALLARIKITENNLTDATEILSLVFEQLSDKRNADILIDANKVKSRLLCLEGEIEDAYKLAVKNVHIAESKDTIPRGVLLSSLTAQAYYAFRLGMLSETEELLKRAHTMVVPGNTEGKISIDLITVRLLIGNKEIQQAERLLDCAAREALEKKLAKKRIEALILRSALHHQLGQSSQAVLTINEALEDGSKHSIVDIFLLEEKRIGLLICEMLSERKLRRETRQFAKSIILQLPHLHTLGLEDNKEKVLKRSRLTGREQEVLDLLNLGMTRKEIAEELSISPNTTKVHIANIYSKLNVDNRLDAFHESLESDD